ncbi:MAG: alanine racemase [Saprospiraceae bacterium]|nr:MAG: alanine racemase [Saprospiraceae bacterium]
MLHTSWIEISQSALVNNYKFLSEHFGDEVKISSVVKGNAYGHGLELFVPLAEQCGQTHFSVFSADEALIVKNVSQLDPTIMIMGMVDNAQMEWAIENDLEFFVFEMDRLEAAIKAAKLVGKKASIHLEVETGMNRTGFENSALIKALQLIKEHGNELSFTGLCTHYGGAESIANYYRVKKQKIQYNRILKLVNATGMHPKYLHTACSAAAMRYPTTRMDLSRIGILQYGFFPSQEVFIEYISKQEEKKDPLKRLISWKSRVMDVKRVRSGEFIGYGTSFLANSEMNIASIPVGYSHGFSRSLSNQGRVLIHGKRVSVVGTVNMNMMLVDATDLEGVKKGDEVVLIGKQGDLEISVASFAEFSEQVNYELLTRLPANIPRKIVD